MSAASIAITGVCSGHRGGIRMSKANGKSKHVRPQAPLRHEAVRGYRHESLRLQRIAIAERCSLCRLWVRADGRTFIGAIEVMAARNARNLSGVMKQWNR